jgi:hypothetical protein
VTTSNINVGGQVIITGATKGLDVTSNIELGGRLKFDSNVFIDTLRVADVATNLVTYDQSTGELLDSGGTFLNKFAVVSEQPPSDLFANTTTVTNHGSYTLTTSNLATNSNTYNAFDGTANAWTGGTGMYVGGSNVLIETNLTQLSNLHPTQFGDWLAIEFPYKTTLRHMKLTPATVWQSFPYAANLYATNNDLTWTEIKYWDGLNPGSASNVQTITVNATEQFKKYALVTTKLVPNTNIASAVALQDWQLFTESFSIDGGKVEMASSVVMGGETTMDQHGPHSRGEAKLKKYPEIVFEEGKFDGNDSTNTYTQAGYTVTASSTYSTYSGWKVFDGVSNVDTKSWYSGDNLYSGGTPVGTGSGSSKLDTNVDVGEYLVITLPFKIKASYAIVSPRTNGNYSPKSGKFYGYDGNSWIELSAFTNKTYTPGSFTKIDIDSTTFYEKFAIVSTEIAATTSTYTAIGELQLYGYEEDPPAGDTSVDTTFTSIMNTPQTTGANVYVDGNLGETLTNRVTGPDATGTSATYDETGKYWELNGSLESNIAVEANTFLEGDAPHSVSVWFNSSNLVSNASNSCIFSLGTEERLDHVSAAFSNNYQTVQKILSSDLEANDRFGYSVSMSSDGTKFIVGAFSKDDDVGNIADAGAAYIYTYNGSSWDEQKLLSPDIEASPQFGVSVSMSSDGTRVIVGAPRDDEGASDTGAAYIYTYSGGSWDAGTKIVASDKEQDDRFGYSVAMSGDGTKVIVGAYQEDHDLAGGATLTDAGSAYIFTYTGSSWGTGTKIVASDRAESDVFGRSVAMNSDGTKVIVGGGGGEAAYIITYNGSSWVEQQILVASDAAAGDKFGYSVAMNPDGTKVIVGAYFEDAEAGAAYIYTYNGSSWDTGTKIVASDKEAGDRFGSGVSMNSDGTKVIVGAQNEHAGGITDAGAAYIFAYDGSNWDTGLKISAPDKEASDQFSSDKQGVAMSGDGARVVVGANLDDVFSANSGAVYVYDRDTIHHLTTDLKLQSNTWHNLTYAYQGEGGSRVTYLDGRKVAEDQAEDTFGDYPPFAMTGYAQGGYVASTSNEYDEGVGNLQLLSWMAFDNTAGTRWDTANDGNYNSSGVHDGSVTTEVDGTPESGEWIQLEFPHKLRPSHFTLNTNIGTGGSYNYQERAPKTVLLVGSNTNNGTDWVSLFNNTSTPRGSTPSITLVEPFTVSSTNCYKYFRLIVLTTFGGTSGSSASITELQFYGHRENDLVRLPDPTNVLKYPHIAMTGPAQRGYVASASSTAQAPYLGFTPATSASAWVSGNTTDYDGANNDYNATTYRLGALVGGGNTEYGEWLKLELPHKLAVNKMILTADPGGTYGINEAPDAWKIYGSNDDTNWVELLSVTGATPTTSGDTRTISNSTAYKYLAIVITSVHNITAKTRVGGLEYYGTEENSSIPIQIGGGNIDKVANFRVYDKFIGEDQALEIWDAQKDEFGRAKSSMTLQKGRLGIGTTEPEGRLAVLDEPSGLEEFPPSPMTGYKNYFEGHGEFCVSASSELSDTYRAWDAFNHTGTSDPNDAWLAPMNRYTLNNYIDVDPSVAANINGVYGEWLELKLPYKITLDRLAIKSRAGSPYGQPGGAAAGNVWGSNDGVNWTLLTSFTGLTYGGVARTIGVQENVLVNSTTPYSYFRLQPTKRVGVSGTDGWIGFGELRYFGTREQGQSVLHDGELTLTKSLTVPRIGPALDADDTPRRDRLVVEYNTSTNPTSEGAVRDTSGRGLDGVFVGGASYDATEKALKFTASSNQYVNTNIPLPADGNFIHSMSMWFNSASLSASPGDAIVFIGDNTDNNKIEIFMETDRINYLFGGNNYEATLSLTNGRWYHLAVTYNGNVGASGREIYIDGVQRSASHSGLSELLNLTNGNLDLGRYTPSGSSSDYAFDGSISNFKLYDCALTAEEVKTLYDMGRCDEGHHVVNFSKTRVGIGLGDGEAPRSTLDVRGGIAIGNTAGQVGPLHIKFLTNAARNSGTRFEDAASTNYWENWINNGKYFYFAYNGSDRGWIQGPNGPSATKMPNFTGQHMTFIKDISFIQARELEGLIVSSDQNKYIKMSDGIEAGSNAITTNESLPVVSLSTTINDKKCFGVISASEDPETRTVLYGAWGSVAEKEKGDTRVYINSVGEGAIWVSNIGGNLEAGDYITTSNVAGYGQKQDDDVLHNYTVAKITMDCDFEPATQPVQQILRSNVVETYYLGDVHHVKNVPHEFVTTVVGADDDWSNVSVSPSDVTYAEWSNLEANTQNTYTLTYTQTSNVVYDTKYTKTTTANVTESDAWDKVFVDPPTVTYAEWSNLEANTQNTYTLTYTQTTTDEKTPDEWSTLESNVQSLYNKVYYQSVEEEVAKDYPGAVAHTRVTDRIENKLDEHGQIQWEDHPTETEKAYKIRYLDASGVQTDSANAVHIAAFVGCTYHCG